MHFILARANHRAARGIGRLVWARRGKVRAKKRSDVPFLAPYMWGCYYFIGCWEKAYLLYSNYGTEGTCVVRPGSNRYSLPLKTFDLEDGGGQSTANRKEVLILSQRHLCKGVLSVGWE